MDGRGLASAGYLFICELGFVCRTYASTTAALVSASSVRDMPASAARTRLWAGTAVDIGARRGGELGVGRYREARLNGALDMKERL